MNEDDGQGRRPMMRSPIATPERVSSETSPFPAKTLAAPVETFFADWRARLMRNLSRRSTSRWEPLTWVHSAEVSRADESSIPQPARFHEHVDAPLCATIEATFIDDGSRPPLRERGV